MSYVKYNKDGSIKELSITESINQGNDGVNKIFATFDAMPFPSIPQTVKALFELPDDTVVESANLNTTTQNNETGFQISIPKAATKYAGIIKVYLLLSNGSSTLYTQQVPLLVNKTPFVYEEEE